MIARLLSGNPNYAWYDEVMSRFEPITYTTTREDAMCYATVGSISYKIIVLVLFRETWGSVASIDGENIQVLFNIGNISHK